MEYVNVCQATKEDCKGIMNLVQVIQYKNTLSAISVYCFYRFKFHALHFFCLFNVQELAEYEKLEDRVKITHDMLEKDGFGEQKFFSCKIAKVQENGNYKIFALGKKRQSTVHYSQTEYVCQESSIFHQHRPEKI